METKFKIGDIVRIGRPGDGYDIGQILGTVICYNPVTTQYHLKVLTRTGYLAGTEGVEGLGSIYYTYPQGEWEMEYVENALQRLKKRYEDKV